MRAMGRLRITLVALCAAATLYWPVAARAQNTFARIKSRGVAVVATEADYAPFEFRENGKIVGYDEDILKLVIKGWGVKLDQQDLPFAGILAGLLAKKYDFVATALLMNPERAAKYAFTMPVAVSKVGIMKRRGDTKLKNVDDLTGLTIGVPIPPSGPSAIFAHFNEELKTKGRGAARTVFFQSSPDMALALANGQIDGAANARLVIAQTMNKLPGKFELVGTFGKPFYIGWVTRPEDTHLRDALNEQIRKILDSGEMAKLQEKWFGFKMEIPLSGYLPPGAK